MASLDYGIRSSGIQAKNTIDNNQYKMQYNNTILPSFNDQPMLNIRQSYQHKKKIELPNHNGALKIRDPITVKHYSQPKNGRYNDN